MSEMFEMFLTGEIDAMVLVDTITYNRVLKRDEEGHWLLEDTVNGKILDHNFSDDEAIDYIGMYL